MTSTITTTETKGLTLYVLRWALGDCTNHGVSSLADRLTLVGTILRGPLGDYVEPIPADSRVFGPTADAPAVALRRRVDSIHLVPVLWDEQTGQYAAPGKHYMAGGNFAALGDSRAYRAATAALGAHFHGAVSIHDRHEG